MRCTRRLGLLAAGALALPVWAETYEVPGDFDTIQAAVNACVDGDEVIVHPGTYAEAVNLLGLAIWLHSSDGPDVTILDGENSFRPLRCVSGETPEAVVEGFTITRGQQPFNQTEGGGMLIQNSSPTVIDCRFVGNAASDFIGEGRGGCDRAVVRGAL